MGKTVTTYLIDGDPKGNQYVFISNKICKMYVIPRSNLSICRQIRNMCVMEGVSCREHLKSLIVSICDYWNDEMYPSQKC